MPPKTKVTAEQIVSAGFDIVRSCGHEALNVRSAAARVGCSTQPVMYQFQTVAELKSAVYDMADRFHSEYIMQPMPADNPLLSIGVRYVMFGAEEKNLFRFLFQTDKFSGMGFDRLFDSDELAPIYSVLSRSAGIPQENCKDVFKSIFISAHGLASLLANNAVEFRRDYTEKILTSAFYGAVGAAGGYNHEKII